MKWNEVQWFSDIIRFEASFNAGRKGCANEIQIFALKMVIFDLKCVWVSFGTHKKLYKTENAEILNCLFQTDKQTKPNQHWKWFLYWIKDRYFFFFMKQQLKLEKAECFSRDSANSFGHHSAQFSGRLSAHIGNSINPTRC